MLITVIWICVALAAVYLYFQQKYSMFTRKGIKNLPCVPLVGNIGRTVLKLEHFTAHINRCYFSFPDERFVGRFEFIKPSLLLRDIDLVKKITIKDFEHFHDHNVVFNEVADPLIGRSLISLKGKEWRDMRSTLSPAFTSSKIRKMVPFMVEVGDQMIKTLKLKIKESHDDHLDVDVKDLMTRYANDVIASCAFGLKVDSHNETNNQFYKMAKGTTTFTIIKFFLILLLAPFPKILKRFDIAFIPNEVNDYFRKLVMGTMRMREENHITRPDMIHLLMEAKKGSLNHEDENAVNGDAGFATVEESDIGKKKISQNWSDDDLTAQAVIFILAGFDTVSTGMSFLLHELALNPDVQEKLVREIKENHGKNGGKFDFNSIQNMTYMDMVVSETLRLWPPAIMSERLCLKDYNCGKPNNNSSEDYILKKGTSVFIPTWSFHRDPQFFPDPLRFDPERFSEENRHKINPNAYLPFGAGPRNCIGSRFALCEMKVMVYQLLLEVEISPAEKTCIPAELDIDSGNMRLKGGHWARIRLRE